MHLAQKVVKNFRMVPEWVTGDLLVVLAFCFRKLLAHVFVTRNAVAVSCALLCYRSCPCVSPERELNLDRTRSLLEVGPFNLLPGYAAGMPGRTLPVERVGSDLNTRGYLDPAGNDATGTRVARFDTTRGWPPFIYPGTRRVYPVGPYPFNG